MALADWELEGLMLPGDIPTLGDLLPSRPAWMARGACRDRPDVTFVPNCESLTAATTALEVCAGCPAKGPCLAYALDDDSLLGIWAGTTTAERRVMRRTPKQRAS